MTQADAVLAIIRERGRQETLCAAGKFRWTAAHADCPNEKRLSALGEEFGEVCRALHDDDREGLRRELVEVAAVSLAWLESF